MKRTRQVKPRDPSWRVRRALGHKIVRDKTKYRRKEKHKNGYCITRAST